MERVCKQSFPYLLRPQSIRSFKRTYQKTSSAISICLLSLAQTQSLKSHVFSCSPRLQTTITKCLFLCFSTKSRHLHTNSTLKYVEKGNMRFLYSVWAISTRNTQCNLWLRLFVVFIKISLPGLWVCRQLWAYHTEMRHSICYEHPCPCIFLAFQSFGAMIALFPLPPITKVLSLWLAHQTCSWLHSMWPNFRMWGDMILLLAVALLQSFETHIRDTNVRRWRTLPSPVSLCRSAAT